MVESDLNYRKYKDIEMRRNDPYGFWTVYVPELSRETYTNVREAYNAVESYLKNRPEKKADQKVRK